MTVGITTAHRSAQGSFPVFIPFCWFLVNLVSAVTGVSDPRMYYWKRFDGPTWPNVYPEDAMSIGKDVSGLDVFAVVNNEDRDVSSYLPGHPANEPKYTKILCSFCQPLGHNTYWTKIDRSKPATDEILQRAVLVNANKSAEFYIGRLVGIWAIQAVVKNASNYLVMRDLSPEQAVKTDFELLQMIHFDIDDDACRAAAAAAAAREMAEVPVQVPHPNPPLLVPISMTTERPPDSTTRPPADTPRPECQMPTGKPTTSRMHPTPPAVTVKRVSPTVATMTLYLRK